MSYLKRLGFNVLNTAGIVLIYYNTLKVVL